MRIPNVLPVWRELDRRLQHPLQALLGKRPSKTRRENVKVQAFEDHQGRPVWREVGLEVGFDASQESRLVLEPQTRI